MENRNNLNSEVTGPENTPENLFFNVMPQKGGKINPEPVREAKPVTSPEPLKKIIIQRPAVTQPTFSSSTESFSPPKSKNAYFRKFVKTLIVLVLLFSAGFGGYYGYKKLPKFNFNLSDKTENLQKPEQKVTEEAPKTFATTPKAWLLQYFGTEGCDQEKVCGDNADPDKDGLENLEEQRLSTDPNNSDSDKDGISDGDEVHITLCDPLKSNTAGNEKYNDADDFKGTYDCRRPAGNDEAMSLEQISSVAKKMEEFGLHEPTISTLKDYASKYKVLEPVSIEPEGGSETKQSVPDLVEKTPEAMLERDTQRAGTIKKIGIALTKFMKDAGYYPQTNSFFEMLTRVKPYNQVATNPTDPLNRDAFVYTYTTNKDATDFVLTYYSETQNQLIKYTSANAEKDATADSASENDDQRVRDLENIRSALLIYSTANVAGSQANVFPSESKYISELVPRFISDIPKDPKTNLDYEYKVSKNYDSFTLKAKLENSPSGTTYYVCNQDDCQNN